VSLEGRKRLTPNVRWSKLQIDFDLHGRVSRPESRPEQEGTASP
jgi:hypothetical protein